MIKNNYMKNLLLLGCLIAFGLGLSIKNVKAQNQTDAFEEVLSDKFDGVIFPKNKVPELLNQCSRSAPRASEYWQPTKEDILRLEQALPEYVKANPMSCGDLSFNLNKYKRQYGGVIVQGRKVVYVNAFIVENDKEHSWKNNFYGACDGGCGFWGVEFDIKSGKLSNLGSNGVF